MKSSVLIYFICAFSLFAQNELLVKTKKGEWLFGDVRQKAFNLEIKTANTSRTIRTSDLERDDQAAIKKLFLLTLMQPNTTNEVPVRDIPMSDIDIYATQQYVIGRIIKVRFDYNALNKGIQQEDLSYRYSFGGAERPATIIISSEGFKALSSLGENILSRSEKTIYVRPQKGTVMTYGYGMPGLVLEALGRTMEDGEKG